MSKLDLVGLTITHWFTKLVHYRQGSKVYILIMLTRLLLLNNRISWLQQMVVWSLLACVFYPVVVFITMNIWTRIYGRYHFNLWKTLFKLWVHGSFSLKNVEYFQFLLWALDFFKYQKTHNQFVPTYLECNLKRCLHNAHVFPGELLNKKEETLWNETW